MRIISMVPSWTETLIEAGADVVGRSRFCIHPKEAVKGIPSVGGTKNWDVEQVLGLHPDLLVLDKEENTLEMAQLQTTAPIFASHVESVQTLPAEMRRLSEATKLPSLSELARRLESTICKIQPREPELLPGIVQWIRRPSQPIVRVVYLIWKDPWMSVSPNTFIGSMLSLFLTEGMIPTSEEKYPTVDLTQLDRESTLLLFSSEPYPFHRKPSEIFTLGFPSAVVNGEYWSWFGVRSLRFLEASTFL
jgi:ABC-type Fe3+-hydroxamate transport system substrate-binding protein